MSVSPFPPDLLAQAEALLAACRARGWRIATAESCTGGLVAALLTEIAGSSDVVDRGFVTYSNAAKTALVGVLPELIAAHGAVSEPVARAMAEGALKASDAHLSIAITGVAGPGGGTPDKPVGTVWFATAVRGGKTVVRAEFFDGMNRSAVRMASLQTSISFVRTCWLA